MRPRGFLRYLGWQDSAGGRNQVCGVAGRLTERDTTAYKPLTTAVRNWHRKIFAYSDHRITNAYTETLKRLPMDAADQYVSPGMPISIIEQGEI